MRLDKGTVFRPKSTQRVNLMDSVFDDRLASFFLINVRKKNGEWQAVNLLLDTGFNGELEINATLLSEYDLATRPDHELLGPKEVLGRPNFWDPKAPYKGTIEWEGGEHEAGIRPGIGLGIEGMLGTELLKWRRLTIDAIEGGAVAVTSIPPQRSRHAFRWRSSRTSTRGPFLDDLEEYWRWAGGYIPWTEIQIQDSDGRFNCKWVNADTGNNQELNLPVRMVDRLGLKATGRSRINTPDGLVELEQGEVEVIWLGKRHQVRCVHWPNDRPPHIGMKLLKGNRITVDFDDDMPIADIRPIPRPDRSVREFLGSLGDRFYRRRNS